MAKRKKKNSLHLGNVSIVSMCFLLFVQTHNHTSITNKCCGRSQGEVKVDR